MNKQWSSEIDEAMHQWLTGSVSQCPAESMVQRLGESMNQRIGESTLQWINGSTIRWTNESMHQNLILQSPKVLSPPENFVYFSNANWTLATVLRAFCHLHLPKLLGCARIPLSSCDFGMKINETLVALIPRFRAWQVASILIMALWPWGFQEQSLLLRVRSAMHTKKLWRANCWIWGPRDAENRTWAIMGQLCLINCQLAWSQFIDPLPRLSPIWHDTPLGPTGGSHSAFLRLNMWMVSWFQV